jgi:hypothetical protein
LRSRLGDACVDAPGANWVSPVVVNPCNGADTQRWNLRGQQFESVAFPGNCLQTSADDLFSHLGNCFGSFAQNWTIQDNGHITNVTGFYCLTATGGTGPGTWVGSRYCGGNANQGWDLVS